MTLVLTDGQLHPWALGIPKHVDSPFVRQLESDRLSITQVLTPDSRGVDIRTLPRDYKSRPRVYCPFCGRRGKYHLTEKHHHFCHSSGSDKCVASDLETVLHRRAKRLLLEGLRKARRATKAIRVSVSCRRCAKPLERELLERGSWKRQSEEVLVASGFRLDVATSDDQSVNMAFEVKVTHAVDDHKVAKLLESRVPGIEIDASTLIDQHTGKERWDHTQPIVQIRHWGLEQAPRKLMICGSCRRIDETTALAIKVVDNFSRQDTIHWQYVCRSLDVQDDWQQALAKTRTPEVLLRAAFSPECSRRERELPSTFVHRPRELVQKMLERLELVALGRRAWTDETPLLPDPHAALVAQFTKLSGSLDSNRKLLQGPEWIEQLKFADRVLCLAEIEPTDNRWVAWIGFGLIEGALRYGNTAYSLARLGWHVAKYHLGNPGESSSLAANVRRIGANELFEFLPGGSRVGLRPLVAAERQCAKLLRRLNRRGGNVIYTSCVGSLTGEQRKAVEAVRGSRLVVLTGGAGTGKTTTLSSVIRSFPELKWIVLAPTGKATQRLKEALGGVSNVLKTYTVAKFLVEACRSPDVDSVPRYNAVAVDEFGFLGVEQAQKLLTQIERRVKRVFLIGDPNQLPSISPGSVLSDIIKLARRERPFFHEVNLSKNLRAKGTAIPGFARRIQVDNFWPRCSTSECVRLVEPGMSPVDDVVREFKRLMKTGGGELQVIAPTRDLVSELNERLQRERNKHGTPLKLKSKLRVGDRVVCTKNIYSSKFNLMNGFLGTIVGEEVNYIRLRDTNTNARLRVRKEDVQHLSLGYAITIHKAQGSEWKDVIVVVPDNCGGFVKRSMLYTAVTRARSRLLIVGRGPTLDRALRGTERRSTCLREFVEELSKPARCPPTLGGA